jgi:hypothetical protein
MRCLCSCQAWEEAAGLWRNAWLRQGEDWRVACYRNAPARPHVCGWLSWPLSAASSSFVLILFLFSSCFPLLLPLLPILVLLFFSFPSSSSSCFYSFRSSSSSPSYLVFSSTSFLFLLLFVHFLRQTFLLFFSPLLFLFFIQPFTRLRKVRPGYNDIGLCDTSPITSDIVRYQLISHC